jgi:hypothetical protein
MTPPARGRLLAYAPYQVKDFLLERASLPLALILLIMVPQVYLLRQNMTGGVFRGDPRQLAGRAHELFGAAGAVFLYLAAFLGGIAIAPLDRQPGHFRFYFSKPVSVRAYYAQRYLVTGLTLVALYGVLTAVYGSLTAHQSLHRSMEAAALIFALIGGLGFLFGAITNWDSIAVVLLMVVAIVLQQVGGESPTALPAWANAMARALPPVLKLDQLRDGLHAAKPLDAGRLWHVLGYGGGAFLLGLFLYRRTPLAR